jgi:hypothetical protein
LNNEVSDICRATYRFKKACIDDDTSAQVTFAVGRLLLPKLLKVGVKVTSELRCVQEQVSKGFPTRCRLVRRNCSFWGEDFIARLALA